MTFDDFWSNYPRKVGKGAAERAWKTAIKKAPPATILVGLDKSIDEWVAKGTEKQFIPHASTWLNQRRWEDEHDEPQQPLYEQPQEDLLAKPRPKLKPKMRKLPGPAWTREQSAAALARMKAEAQEPTRPTCKLEPRRVPMDFDKFWRDRGYDGIPSEQLEEEQ